MLRFHQTVKVKRSPAYAKALFYIVMARIANPASKSRSVRYLEQHFGVTVPLDKVYRMMDRLDLERIERARQLVEDATRALLPERTARVMFFDCTTVAFETAAEDGLRQKGFSKDRKPGESLALLALAASEEGLPLSYEVLPGSTWEGHSLVPVLQEMKRRQGAERTVCVADRGMLSKDNLAALEELGEGYVVGVKLRSLPDGLKERVLDLDSYRPMEGADGILVAEFEHRGCRLIVTWRPEWARKDGHDRRQAVDRLARKLKRSGGNPKDMISNRGSARFLAVEGEARLAVDGEKIAEAERWDGLAGVVTNLRDMSAAEVLAHYRGLWQVEESFRITKHDLRARPVFHWTERRVRTHMAIACMAFACVRHLAYRVSKQQERMSPERIRLALVNRQASIWRCARSGRRFCIPSKPSRDAERIYAAMGIPLGVQGSLID